MLIWTYESNWWIKCICFYMGRLKKDGPVVKYASVRLFKMTWVQFLAFTLHGSHLPVTAVTEDLSPSSGLPWLYLLPKPNTRNQKWNQIFWKIQVCLNLVFSGIECCTYCVPSFQYPQPIKDLAVLNMKGSTESLFPVCTPPRGLKWQSRYPIPKQDFTAHRKNRANKQFKRGGHSSLGSQAVWQPLEVLPFCTLAENGPTVAGNTKVMYRTLLSKQATWA